MHGRLRARPGAVGARRHPARLQPPPARRRTGRASSRSWPARSAGSPRSPTRGVTRMINGPEAFTPDNEFILGESEVRGLLRRRRVLRPRDRRRGRHRAPDGPLDRRRRAGARPVEDGHPPLRRPVPQPRATPWPAPTRTTPPTTTSTTRTRSAWRAGRCALSPAYARLAGARRVVRREGRVGAAELVRAERRRRRGRDGRGRSRRSGRAAGPAEHWSPAIGAEALATRADGRAVRRDVVRQDRGRGPGRAPRSSSGCAPTTSTGAVGTITYTADAQPPRRHRVRLHRHPARGRPLPDRDRHRVRQPRPRLDPAPRCRRDGLGASINDVTSAPGLLRRCGARAPATSSQSATTDDLSDAAFPYLTAREITVGDVPVLALRVTYVGELGWELYAPAEYGRALWDTLWEAGAAHGLVAGGYRAIDALRLEKGYRVWSSDITPEETPYEAGLGFAVALDKGDFLGRDALVAAKAVGPAEAAALPRARRPALGLPRQRARAGRRRGSSAGSRRGGYGFAVERSHRLRLPPAGRAAIGDARRGRGVRRRGSASRSRASRCTTRRARGSGPERHDRPDVRPTARTGRRRRRAARTRSSAAGSTSRSARATRPTRSRCEHFRRDLDLERKPDRTFVTVADTGDRAAIRDAHRSPRFPDHGLVGEEYGEAAGGAAVRWYIDPIDGTHNFMRGVPAVRDAARGGARRRAAGRRDLGAGAARALVRVARRGGVGDGAGRAPRRIRVSRVGLDRGRPAACTAATATTWRVRPDARVRRA